MKTNKITSIVLLILLLVGACKQTPIEPTAPEPPVEEVPDPGTADFSKFVALGDSYVAGAQGATMFNLSQTNSLPNILATQFTTVGGGAFNQPLVNHENGLNFSIFAATAGAVQLGRYLLFDPDGDLDPDGTGCATSRTATPRAAGTPAAAAICPSTSPTPAMPLPYNTAQTVTELVSYAGDRTILNNFGVPGTRVFHTTVAAYGAAPPTGSPWYFRQATNPGTSTLLGDAASKGHKFFLLSLGLFDVFGYATTGAIANPNGTGAADMTPEAVFNPSYDANLAALLTDPAANGVVTTIPDVTSLPFFFTVTYNNIEFKSSNCNDAALIGGLNGVFGLYNQALDYLLATGSPGLTAEDVARRKVVFNYGKNPILIQDETLLDLTTPLTTLPSPPFPAPYNTTVFAQFGKLRPATATDLIVLSAGSILGTCNPGAPAGWPATLPYLYGVASPLSDGNVLIPTEILEIQARTDAFNAHIKAAADGYAGRVAIADLNAAYKELVANKAGVADGVTITPTFAPPTGIFSEDGVHPNSRGYAFTANIIIDAINAKFSAKIPKAKLSKFIGTGLPVNGQ